MSQGINSRREFLSKALAAVGFALLSTESILRAEDGFPSNGNQPLDVYTVDLSQYPDLDLVEGSVAITISGSIYSYPGNINLPFRFILTRSGAETFLAEEGYCTHQQTALDPYNGSFILCPNPDPGHGSKFDINGTVIQKPARRNLTQYNTAYDPDKKTVDVVVPSLTYGVNSADFTSELYQNFPNPVKSTTTIRFKLAYYSKVTLIVTDMLGHIIGVLNDGSLAAGEYSFEFDASIWNSGTYFYQLNIDGLLLTKQMIIAK